MSRLAVVHAGCGQWSASRELALQLTAAARRTSPVPVEAQVLAVSDVLGPMHAALAGDPWDPLLLAARTTIANADGVIAVTPIVHGSYSGPFKSFVDLLGGKPLQGKPVLIAACGGTLRHCLALDHVIRPLFVCLRCAVVPTAVYATSDECGPEHLSSCLSERIERAARELMAVMSGA